MRRLPILVVVDANSIKDTHTFREFIQRLICGFRNNPFMLETICISIIYLNYTSYEEIIPFVELFSIDDQHLEAINSIDIFHGECTMPNLNISEVINSFLDKNLLTTDAYIKGDWPPTILLFGSCSFKYSLNITNYWAKRIRLLFISEEDANISLSKKNIYSYSMRMEFSETNFLNLTDILQEVIIPHALAVGQEESTLLELNEIQDIIVRPIL